MRPQTLFPLFRDVTVLPGIGPRLVKLVAKAAGPRVVDLLWHLPSGLVDRRYRPVIAEAEDGRLATLEVTVDGHEPPDRPRRPYRVRVRDDSGFLTLVFFHGRPDYLNRVLPQSEKRFISGRIEEFNGTRQITHPDLILKPEDFETTGLVEPVYPVTAGLVPKVMAKAVRAAVAQAPDLDEWQDPAWMAAQGWPSWREALVSAHGPETEEDLDPRAPARQRLAFDELFANQLAMALVRQRMTRAAGRSLKGTGTISARVKAALPFALTGAQEQSVAEILADMGSDNRMMRLLQGDVGSGKTVVACLAMVAAVEAGAQAALMAPTEILARQHFAGIADLLEPAGVTVALLTGREKASEKTRILEALRNGDIPVVIGTHALFQDDVAFQDLGLAIIDEQHRFGVHQRMALGSKGNSGNNTGSKDGGKSAGRAADVLIMTATPIPRTLTLTVYGDMAVSRLTEKPPGRQPVTTRALPTARMSDVIEGLRRTISGGGQAYWVCPLVEESENLDLTSAEDRYAALAEAFPDGPDGPQVALVHGRMKGPEKDTAMAAFKAGQVKILVATTVIEVGVDVPNATVIVIEHAERFGLAQLHQLRGRVGRGTGASSCILLYAPPLGETAKARLKVMRSTEDGFLIAEEDLRLRGAGDVLGTRQSGMPDLRLASLEAHDDLLAVARDAAGLVLAQNPDLTGPRGEALRTLLYLFERDEAVRYVRVG